MSNHIYYRRLTDCKAVVEAWTSIQREYGTPSLRLKAAFLTSYKDSSLNLLNHNNKVLFSHRLLNSWYTNLVLTLNNILYRSYTIQNSLTSIKELKDIYCARFSITGLREQDVRDAYHCFDNLVDQEECLTCVHCKENPETIIFDGNAKLKNTINTLEMLDKNVPNQFEGAVDMERFWMKNKLLVLSRMFGDTTEPKLDFLVAPVISPEVANERVLNTEFIKLNTINDINPDNIHTLTIDGLNDLFNDVATKSDLKSACIELGLAASEKHSISDMRDALRQHFQDRQKTDDSTEGTISEMMKIFPKASGSSGGILFGVCEHGVIYYAKYLIRGEGSRDILDAILSFRITPRYIVYDDAAQVASHAAKRLSFEEYIKLFGPNHGRVLSETTENISIATDIYAGRRLPLEWNGKHTLLLYDRFHERNSKKLSAILRRLNILKRFRNGLNSQAAEQLNRQLRLFTRTYNGLRPLMAMNVLRRRISAINRKRNLVNSKTR